MKTTHLLFSLLLLMGCNGNIINVEPASSHDSRYINEPIGSSFQAQSNSESLDAIVSRVISSQAMQNWNRTKVILLEQANSRLKNLSHQEIQNIRNLYNQGESSKILNITNLEEPFAAFTSASIDLIKLVIQSNSGKPLSDSDVKYVLRRLVTKYSMANGRVEADCPAEFQGCMLDAMASLGMNIQYCALLNPGAECLDDAYAAYLINQSTCFASYLICSFLS